MFEMKLKKVKSKKSRNRQLRER